MDSPGNLRFIRCLFVIMEEIPEIMQHIMQKSGMPPEILYQRILKDDNLRHKKLNPNDMSTIQTLMGDGYKKLDITLIFKIITHYSNMFIPPPTRGWGTYPIELEVSIGDDAQRLRNERNKFVHMINAEVSVKCFIEFFRKMTTICKRVDKYLDLDDSECFEQRIQRRASDHIGKIESENVQKQWKEVEQFEEYFVVDVGDRQFNIYRGKTMREFMEDLPRLDQSESTPITLYFPYVENRKDIKEIVDSISKKLKHSSIEVDRAEYGSLILFILIPNQILLNTTDIIDELTKFFTVIGEEISFQSLSTILTMTITEVEDQLPVCARGGYKRHSEQMFYDQEGPLLLKIHVNNEVFQSENELQHQIEGFMSDILKESNGKNVFSQNQYNVFVEPGDQENSGISRQDSNTDESNNTRSRIMIEEDNNGFSSQRVPKTGDIISTSSATETEFTNMRCDNNSLSSQNLSNIKSSTSTSAKTIDAVKMAMAELDSFTKYKREFEYVLKSLTEGLTHLYTFVEDLKAAFVIEQGELDYIENILKPSIEKAHLEFQEMMKHSSELLSQINSDLEESVSDLERKKNLIKSMDLELATISEDLKGKEKEVKDMEDDCDRKRRELSNAEECLSTARRKLEEAERSQAVVVGGGSGAAAGSLVFSIVFPPALVVAAAGAVFVVAGLTVLENDKKECSKRVDCARSEVTSSESKLQKTKDQKHDAERRLLEVRNNKQLTENKICETENSIKTMKHCQAQIIEINEKIKMCYNELSIFHGRFNVVCCETNGCYSLFSLKSPTKTVCASLQTLLKSAALEACCEGSQLTHLKSQVGKIDRIEWPAITETDDFDDLV